MEVQGSGCARLFADLEMHYERLSEKDEDGPT